MIITLEAGEDKTLSQVGYGFYFNSGSGPIKVTLKEEGGSVIEESVLEPDTGLTRGPVRFEKVTITNVHTETQIVDFHVGVFTYEDNRGGADVTVTANNTLSGLPELPITGVAQVIAANAARKRLVLSAPTSNTDTIWLGSTAVNVGIPLLPGNEKSFDISGALNLIGVNGAKLNIAEVV